MILFPEKNVHRKMLQGDEHGMKIVDEELSKLKAKNDDLKERYKAASTEYSVKFS